MYLYRAVDSKGQTFDFLLNQTRSTRATKRFFRKVLGQSHVTKPRVITVNKNAANPPAIDDLKEDKLLYEKCQCRASKYLNNRIEQDHRFIKRRVKPGLGFAKLLMMRTLQGYEAMYMIRKGHVTAAEKHKISSSQISWAPLLKLKPQLDLPVSGNSPTNSLQ